VRLRLLAVVAGVVLAGCGGDPKAEPTARTVTLDEVRSVSDTFLATASAFMNDMSGCARIANGGDLAGLVRCSREAYEPVEPAAATARRDLGELARAADSGCAAALRASSTAITAVVGLLRSMAEAGRAADADALSASIRGFDKFDSVAQPMLRAVTRCP